ncbi:MAG: hypothetical protein NT067_01510 [Candidatus Diapherotrites archaeon]|nr:hypothetical protein [Candidatus Diapherotrites archaeon]
MKNRQGQILQGVYRQGDGKIIVARFAGDMGFLALYELEDAGRENHLKASEGNLLLPTFFSARLDLAHMRIPEPARGHGFGLKMASRVARHAQVNPVRTSIFSGMAWEENWFDIFQKYPRAFGKIYDKFGPVNRKSPEAILKFKRLAWENGLYIFRTGVSKFDNLFKKLGFEMIVDPDGCRIFLKTGKTSKFNDMEKYCKVEAIDPKTGRTREYVFPVG